MILYLPIEKSLNVALINVAQYISVKPLIYKDLVNLLLDFIFQVTGGYRILLYINITTFL